MKRPDVILSHFPLAEWVHFKNKFSITFEISNFLCTISVTWQNIAIFKLGKEVWWILKTLKYWNFLWIHCVWMSTISQAFGSNSCVRAEFTPEFSIERKKATKRQPLTNQSVTERKKKVTIKATSSLHYTIPRLSFLQSGIGLFANTKKMFFLDSALTSQICFDLQGVVSSTF